MTGDARPTTFVTGAAGFIGTELVKVLMALGHQVFGLARCAEAAKRVRRAGAIPVMGDLLEPGQWQDEAAADWVFHLPPHFTRGQRVTRRRAAAVLKGDDAWAARILGARDAVTERTGATVVDKSVRDLREQAEREVRERLGPDRWAVAYSAGRKTSIDSLLEDIDGIAHA